MKRPVLEKMCPFFMVGNAAQSIVFYRDKLGPSTVRSRPLTS
jgi:hypothetical protein